MNKQKKVPFFSGIISLLMAIMILLLFSFAIRSFYLSKEDEQKSALYASEVSSYYEADTIAQNYLSNIDFLLARTYLQTSGENSYYYKILYLSSQLPEMEGISNTGISSDGNNIKISFLATAKDNTTLCVTLKVLYPEQPEDNFYKVSQWQLLPDTSSL